MTAYEVMFPDYGHTWDDAITVHAADAHNAAEEAVEQFQWRNAEFPAETTVRVRERGGEAEQAFAVAMESVPVYRATEVPL